MRGSYILPAIACVGLALLVGCGDSAGPQPGSSAFPTAAALDVADAMENEADLAVTAFVLDGTQNAIDVEPFSTFLDAGLSGSLSAMDGRANPARWRTPTRCADVAPNPPEDNDGDHVPNDATYTFDPAKCTRTTQHGGTITRSGTLRVTDPAPNASGFDRVETLSGLTLSIQGPGGKSATRSRTGTRTVSQSENVLTADADVDAVIQVVGKDPMTVQRNWNSVFTGATGPRVGEPLPSGTIGITGSATASRGSDAYTFAVSTPALLQYDSTCDAPPLLRIVSGRIQIVRTENGAPRDTVTITFTGCGQRPVREVLPAS